MVFLASFFLLGILGIIILVLYNWLIKTDHVIDYFDSSYKNVKEYFSKINKKDFYERGLEWFILPDIWWIEL